MSVSTSATGFSIPLPGPSLQRCCRFIIDHATTEFVTVSTVILNLPKERPLSVRCPVWTVELLEDWAKDLEGAGSISKEEYMSLLILGCPWDGTMSVLDIMGAAKGTGRRVGP